jgi:hypothetical protein
LISCTNFKNPSTKPFVILHVHTAQKDRQIFMKNRFIKLAAAGALAAAVTITAHAQEPADALRFSLLQPQGTARSIGFGNALGSVGGDFSSLSVNPAGIGIYRKGEFMVTPSLMFNNTDSKPVNAGGFSGSADKDYGQHFSISNFGLVFTNARRGRAYARSGWRTSSLAIGMNRLADFTRNYSYRGTNTATSASWIFEDDANRDPGGVDNDLYGTTPGYLGYQSYLLDNSIFPNGDTGYVSVVNPSVDNPIGQRTNVRERGGISEFVLSFGGNYEEKLMLGATIGLPYIRYVREKTFEETDQSGNPNNDFDYFNYNERLRTTGLGINAKLGFIYKPIDEFRFGGAIHTPTVFGLQDNMETRLTANTENFGGVRSVQGQDREYDYTLITPWRAVASATALFGKLGFITLDYEYVAYGSSRFRMDNIDADLERYTNDGIKASYRGASNVRGGVELRLGMLSLRGGIGYYGDPYKKTIENYVNGERWDFSGGLGFRMRQTFIDLGFVHHQYKSSDQPYVAPYDNLISPTARLNNRQSNAVLTVGWKF